MQELKKIIEEIEAIKTGYDTGCRNKCKFYDWSVGACIGECEEYIKKRVKEIIRKHMNDDWISVDERMPTQEECKDNLFWITYDSSFSSSSKVAKCQWVFSYDENGNDDSYSEFYIDQSPCIYTPSQNLVKAWKIIDIPEPYRLERSEKE